MSPTPYLWVLLASTFCLSALWAAVLLVLVRVHRPEAGRSHMGVELAWAVTPVLLVLAVVLPTLQSGSAPGEMAAGSAPRVAEAVEASPERGAVEGEARE